MYKRPDATSDFTESRRRTVAQTHPAENIFKSEVPLGI